MGAGDLGVLNIFYVYYLRRPDKEDPLWPGAGQPFYVGKGSNGRMGDHRYEALFLKSKPGPKSLKTNIIHKLWRQGLDFTEEIMFESLTEQEAHEIEIEAISVYGRKNNGTGCLANLTNGGDGVSGLIHSDETRKELSRKSKEVWNDPEYRERMSRLLKGRPAPNKGISPSEESRQKMRESHIGIQAGENHPNYGKHLTEETKEKIRCARSKQVSSGMKGLHHTQESIDKMKESLKGRVAWNKGLKNPYEISEKTRENMSRAQKGHITSLETREKISRAQIGKHLTEEQKENLRQKNLGRKDSSETVEKRKESTKITWKFKRWDKIIGDLSWI